LFAAGACTACTFEILRWNPHSRGNSDSGINNGNAPNTLIPISRDTFCMRTGEIHFRSGAPILSRFGIFVPEYADTLLQRESALLWIYTNSQQALFPSPPRALKTPYRKYREVMRAFWMGNPYLYSENPFSSWRSKLESCTHGDKITSQAWTGIRRLRFGPWLTSTSGGETERKSEMYTYTWCVIIYQRRK